MPALETKCAHYAQASPLGRTPPCSPNVRCDGHSPFGCVNSGKRFAINALIGLFCTLAITAVHAATFARRVEDPAAIAGRPARCQHDLY
jgi:hypothetical protein